MDNPKTRPMRKYRMYTSRQTYEEVGNGVVRVTNHDGRSGLFRWDGLWLEGDVREANTNMLIYTGGPDVHPAFAYRWLRVPQDAHRPSGWPIELERHLEDAGLL